MGRIRTIKPEFATSESNGRLSREARLCFVLLMTIADDEGRTRGASRGLASALYPYDDDAPTLIGDWLDELEHAGKIRRYQVDGDTYLEITKWLDHQKIDRPSPSKIPPFREVSERPREPSRALAPDLGPRTLDQGPRTESRAQARATVDEVVKLFEEFWSEYPQRAGGNPKAPAVKAFARAVATGRKHEIDEATAAAVIGGARRFAAECRDRGKVGSEFVPHAATWLNQKRWQDYPERPAEPEISIPAGKHYAEPESDQLRAWDRWSRRTRGKGLPRDKRGGWVVDSEWPPEIDPPAPVASGDNSAHAA